MSHKFSRHSEALKSENRKKILPVEIFEREIVRKLKFKNVAVDYGAGIGYFTIPLAKHFKKVYSIEANKEMLEALRKELEEAGVKNVGLILSEEPPELDFEIDFVLFSNVLHEVDDHRRFLKWASWAKVVCVIEWKRIETEFGPPMDERIDEREMEEALKEHFRFVKKLEIYPYHYTLLGYNEELGAVEIL
ncbi:MAG: hypothetical protein PWR13_491 [Archaeoglobi archaeon]|nr:hypothetical protein [Archaeoglobi archaeon]